MDNKELIRRRIEIDNFRWTGLFGAPHTRDYRKLKELTPYPIRSAFADLIGMSFFAGMILGGLLLYIILGI